MRSKAREEEKSPEILLEAGSVCVICGKPATTLVDGDPSCEEHIELVYEDQLEDYTLRHQTDDEWLEKKA